MSLTVAACDNPPAPTLQPIAHTTIVASFDISGESPVRSAALLNDSTAAVLFDPGTQVKLLYANGASRTIGRAGDGPGEFRDAAWVAAINTDAFVVIDAARRRASLWSVAGERLAALSVDFPFMSGVWTTDSGAVLRSHSPSQCVVRFHRIDFAADSVTTIREVPVETQEYATCRHCYSTLSRSGQLAMTSAESAYAVIRWDSKGNMIGIARNPLRPLVRLSALELDSAKAFMQEAGRYLVSRGRPDTTVARLLRELPPRHFKPRLLPYGLFWDATGSLLAQPHVPAEAPAQVDVFSASGVYCGPMTLHKGMRVVSVALPLLLAVQYGFDGTESLHLLRAEYIRSSESPQQSCR